MSRELKGRKIVVYPQYIDSTKTRRQGRKISLEDSVRRPSVDEIYEAAKQLGLNPIIDEGRYPKSWWEDSGRVFVDKKDTKLNILRMISRKIKELRR